jgi:ATP-dependent helicase/nuclease subunit A
MSDSIDQLIARALDPGRSVVVEACAGSGKTWLLASRILRLLLAGVAPGEILAITFTRKAAREIEARVVDWLRLLATDSETKVIQFLAERGVHAATNSAVLSTARALYEGVVGTQPGLAVNTFHGWFLQLVDAAPLSANLAGSTLVDPGSRLFDELWQSFAAELQTDAQGELAQDFVWLLAETGLASTRRLVRRGMERRAEWLAFSAGQGDPLAYALGELRADLGVEAHDTALAEFFADNWALEFHAYLGLLEMSELESDRSLAAKLSAALSSTPEACSSALFSKFFARLCEVFLTKTGTLRVRKHSKTLDGRFGVDGAARFLALHARLGAQLIDCRARQLEERIYAFNRRACRVLHAFLAHVDAFKAARRQFDFVDAEWRVLQLLRDEETAAFLQARLDARYSHVLLDEFQDTNPLQWQILLAWLGAYSDAARPSVFLVGDPKQSIYRFRRAEPKLFAAAAEFLVANFAAVRCAQDSTRRNAQPIIDVVNALFLDVPEFTPFRPQQSLAGALPGRVELLPLCGADEEKVEAEEVDEQAAVSTRLRDPLHEAESDPVDSRRRREASALAEKIQAMVGVWLIDETNAGGGITRRPLRYGDIMLLARRRSQLAEYERALGAAGIPFDAASRGGLLTTLEARDIVALLEFLVTPVADLQLAHALRSPIFACSDEDLLCLAARSEASWWQRLQAEVQAEAQHVGASISPRLARAARLLADWLSAADRLPAHDLLDRIYHQGEVLARYRLAAPLAACAGVEANLRAFLLLALDLDGGRYPSLPRFIDELHALRAADAGDAPDEGAIDIRADAGRVRILTIHGAKGLEAPLVWLLDANATPRAEEAWDVLVDWPATAAAPQHFSFYGRMDERGAARQALFDAESAAAQREELNLLYVAITRARQVFIASGIAGARDKDDAPYRRLAAALEKLGGDFADGCYGDALPQALEAPAHTPSAEAANTQPSAPLAPLPKIGERRSAPDAAERFGILLHALLERRTGKVAHDGWWRDQGFDDSDYQRVLPIVEGLLAAPQLQRFFDPTMFRRAWNEVEIVGSDGVLRRIDRLVDADDALWVIDYKTSASDTPRLAAYREQVHDYGQAVAAVFPGRTVRGVLVFADARVIEVAMQFA